MDLLHRKLLYDTVNYTVTCIGECNSIDEYCDPDCFDFCFIRCPGRLAPFPPTSTHHNLPTRFLVLSLVLGITVISLLCLTIYYKFYSGPCRRRIRDPADVRRRSEIREDFLDEDHGPVLDHPIWYINTVGLQPSVINSISVCKFKKGEGLVEGTDCSVCLSEFEEDDTLRLLPKCNHAFHIPCIDTWLRSHTNCPMCRAPIVVAAPNPAAEGSGSSGAAGGVEGAEIGGSENREESESGDGDEMRIEIEEGDELQLQDEDRRKGIEEEEEEEEGIQPLRRSISLDSISAFKIIQALAVVSDRNTNTNSKENDESSGEIAPKRVDGSSNQSLIRFMASSSIGRSLQIGPSSLKRSISCGGKLFLQRYSRNSSSSTSATLPL